MNKSLDGKVFVGDRKIEGNSSDLFNTVGNKEYEKKEQSKIENKKDSVKINLFSTLDK